MTVMSFRIVQKPGNESSVSAAPARIGDELTTTLQAGTTNQVPLEIASHESGLIAVFESVSGALSASLRV